MKQVDLCLACYYTMRSRDTSANCYIYSSNNHFQTNKQNGQILRRKTNGKQKQENWEERLEGAKYIGKIIMQGNRTTITLQGIVDEESLMVILGGSMQKRFIPIQKQITYGWAFELITSL